MYFLSRLLGEEQTHVDTGNYGTISHAAPERLNNGVLSKASDVWALGLVIWEVLHGQQPFKNMPPLQVRLCVAQGKPPPKVPLLRHRAPPRPPAHVAPPRIPPPAQILYAVMHKGHRPPIADWCPPQLAELMQRCWVADPQARPDAAAVAAALQDYAATLVSAASTAG